MTTSALECLGRGLASLRANWPLVLLQWLQQVVVTLLTVAGLLVPVAAVGPARLREVLKLAIADPATAGEPLLALVAEIALPLAIALVATLVVWTLAFLVACWFQGGFYGVLTAAQRQAPPRPGAGGDPRLFRTFSLPAYAGWGARYLWRYFWFWNLYGVVLLGVVLLGALLLLAAAAGFERWGGQAAVAIGCGGLLPLLVVLLLAALWGLLAAAALGREEATVLSASRHALTVLARRPLAVLLIAAVGLVGAVLLSALFLPPSLLASGAGKEAIALQVAVMLAQALAGAGLTTFLAAACVALVASEPQALSGGGRGRG